MVLTKTALCQEEPPPEAPLAGRVAPPDAPMMNVEVEVELGDDAGNEVNPSPPSEKDFDTWIFGENSTEQGFQKWVETLLKLRIERLAQTCSLTNRQRKKLELAGRGDIKHLLNKVDEQRRTFLLVRSDPEKLSMVQSEIGRLGASPRSELFGPNSLFAKSVRTALQPDQISLHHVHVRKQRLAHYQAYTRALVIFCDNAVGLSDQQRTELEGLILQHLRAPKSEVDSEETTQVILSQFVRIDRKRLRPLFDDNQWRLLDHLLKKCGDVPELELERTRILDVDEPPPVAHEVAKLPETRRRAEPKLETSP